MPQSSAIVVMTVLVVVLAIIAGALAEAWWRREPGQAGRPSSRLQRWLAEGSERRGVMTMKAAGLLLVPSLVALIALAPVLAAGLGMVMVVGAVVQSGQSRE